MSEDFWCSETKSYLTIKFNSLLTIIISRGKATVLVTIWSN